MLQGCRKVHYLFVKQMMWMVLRSKAEADKKLSTFVSTRRIILSCRAETLCPTHALGCRKQAMPIPAMACFLLSLLKNKQTWGGRRYVRVFPRTYRDACWLPVLFLDDRTKNRSNKNKTKMMIIIIQMRRVIGNQTKLRSKLGSNWRRVRNYPNKDKSVG